MTTDILNSTEATLPAIAGKIFESFIEFDEICSTCSNREANIDIQFRSCKGCLKLDKYKPHIPITPANAFKWWKWMVRKFYAFEIKQAIHEVVKPLIGQDVSEALALEWFVINLEPMNQIKVICFVAEKGTHNA